MESVHMRTSQTMRNFAWYAKLIFCYKMALCRVRDVDFACYAKYFEVNLHGVRICSKLDFFH